MSGTSSFTAQQQEAFKELPSVSLFALSKTKLGTRELSKPPSILVESGQHNIQDRWLAVPKFPPASRVLGVRSPTESPEISGLGSEDQNEVSFNTDSEGSTPASDIRLEISPSFHENSFNIPFEITWPCQTVNVDAEVEVIHKKKKQIQTEKVEIGGETHKTSISSQRKIQAELAKTTQGGPLVEQKKIVEEKLIRSPSTSLKILFKKDSPIFSSVKPIPATDKKTVTLFLKYVVTGEQDKAEKLLKGSFLSKGKPDLLSQKADVVDLSKREFKNITGFQYAVWALDWYMWKMLLKYISKEEAWAQFVELEEKSTAHGENFNLTPLIEALNTYTKSYDAWYQEKAWPKMQAYWCKVIGRNQLLLPVHMVNQYCYPKRPFYPCPNFEDDQLPRNRKCNVGEWFTCEWNGRKLGDKFAIFRAFSKYACADLGEGDVPWIKVAVSDDVEALQYLAKMCQRQLKNLKSGLMSQRTLQTSEHHY